MFIVRVAVAVVVLLMLLLTLVICVWCFAPRGDLPSQYVTVHMNPSELESLVLRFTPIGTDKADVEHALRRKFRRKWEVIDYVSVGGMSKHNFHVPISEGDYYLKSNFSVFGIMPRIATVKFLFNGEDKLKDVLVIIWDETI